MLKHSAREESDGLLNSSSSSFELLDTEYKGSPKVAGAYKSSSRFARPLWQYALATLLLVALTDLAFLAYISRIFATEYFDAADLPLANPYIGLKELYELGRVEPDRIEPLLNRPRVATQVFRDEPDRAGSRGEHEVWNTMMGTLSPYDRHLLIDDMTRTIAQFRAMDFGMEECSLVLRLPGPSDHVEGKDQPALSSTALQLQICPLDIPRFLDVSAVTWNARPRCAAPPTAFTAAVGAELEVLPRFACAWGTYHSFEVGCAEGSSEECLVDVWSNHNQTWGLYMHQHQTI
ncbi:uncharacterized protein C8Q71DRAFT_568715 [Rhodofomes roseus]|uniref:Ubiquitin 3 binding protein But2 C-terminal domain-containing protein n=1 Tax=Rhodofomes roseus TaxID=34475 RepID=A0ABQ8KIT6_9APHY|nr:uncharacterized protein C8Q71DRAFT_568715 [Rhodofomes roseus]KAH9837916.1 hypothetical protein C8Q71DRAFT_568715 [Rhodofomes roseus]